MRSEENTTRNGENLDKESFNAVIQYSIAAIKSAIIINSGAAITFIAFFTQNVSYFIQENQNYILLGYDLLDALIAWASGIFTGCLSYGFSYFAQRNYSAAVDGDSRENRYGDIFSVVAVICTILSFILFLIGCLVVYSSFNKFFYVLISK